MQSPPAKANKLFKLCGEHIQALCSAPSLEAADDLLSASFESYELSFTGLNEVDDQASELRYWGVEQLPPPGEARILAAARGDLADRWPHQVYSWCHSTSQRMEYPPVNELVWTCDAHRIVRLGSYHWEPGMDLPGGEWRNAAGLPIADVLRWLPRDESPDLPPPAPDLDTP